MNDASDLGDPLPDAGRLLAVDPGSVRTGLALSDPGQSIASPLEVLERLKKGALVQAIAARARQYEAVGVLVGMPVSLDGGEGPMATRSRRLAASLRQEARLPVALADERYTSQAADRAFVEAGVRASDRRGKVDMVAAAVLLQAWLDGRAPSEASAPARDMAEDEGAC